MPRRAFTTCSAGCGALVSNGRCDECQHEADRARGHGASRGYTAKWARFRKRYIGEHPICECDGTCCPPRGCGQLATDVDHIDGSGRNGPRAYDDTNVQALAHGCHSRKTVREDGGFGR